MYLSIYEAVYGRGVIGSRSKVRNIDGISIIPIMTISFTISVSPGINNITFTIWERRDDWTRRIDRITTIVIYCWRNRFNSIS